MTKEQLIAQLKLNNPTINYAINNELFQMDTEKYEATIESWANAFLEKEKRVEQAQKVLKDKISAYQKLGLTEAEIETLIPKPIES